MKNSPSNKITSTLTQDTVNMTNAEFRNQANSILTMLSDSLKQMFQENKFTSKQFFDCANKEIDILSKMIDSDEYTSEQKIEFSNRIAKLVDKLYHKNVFKDLAIIVPIGVLGLLVFKLVIKK